MPAQSCIKEIMQKYIDGFNGKDASVVYMLFSDNAKIEDPVGGGRTVEGREAINAFYKMAVNSVEKLELEAPIRGSHGNEGLLGI